MKKTLELWVEKVGKQVCMDGEIHSGKCGKVRQKHDSGFVSAIKGADF